MAGLCLCAALARAPFLFTVGVDESFYLVVARQWLEGTPPYAGAFDVKPPLLFALLALAESIFGPSLFAAKALAMAAVAATACGLYLFGRRILGELAGAAAGLFYIASTVTPGGVFSPAELIMAPFTAFGMLAGFSAAQTARPKQIPLICPADRHPGQAKREPGSQKKQRFNLLRSRIRPRLSGMTASAIRWHVRQILLSPSSSLVAGFLFGAAACVKQTALFEALPLAAYLFFGRPFAHGLRAICLFASGFCVIPAAFALYYYAHGHLDALVADAIVSAAGRAGASYISWGEAIERLSIDVALALPLVVMAAAVLFFRGAFREHQAYRVIAFLAAWAAAALAAVLAARAMFVIYFLPLLQPLSLAAGLCFERGVSRLAPKPRYAFALPAAFAAIALYSAAPSLPLIFAGRDNLASAAAAAAAMRAAGLLKEDRILVADRDLIVYLASGANPPGPVFHPLQFLCRFSVPGADSVLKNALNSRPAFIVAAEPVYARACEEPGRRPMLQAALARDYCPIGRFASTLTGEEGGAFVVYGLRERAATRCA